MTVCVLITLSANVAHHALLAWAHSSVVSEGRYIALAVETPDLKLTKLDVEVGNKVLKDVTALSHQLGSLLVSQDFLNVLLGSLKVGEQKNEYLFRVARDFHQVNSVANLMEIPVKNLSAHLNTCFTEADCHGRRTFLGDDVDFVRALGPDHTIRAVLGH